MAAAPRQPPPYDSARALRHLRRVDPTLGAAMRAVGPFRLQVPPRVDPYRHLLESIVYQQLAGKAAAAIFGRLCLQIGGGRVPGRRRLAATPIEALRAAGLSINKALAVQDLARRASRGELPRQAELAAMSDAAIVERLTAVRGVGPWTVEMLLLFGLGRPDVLPVADYGVRKGYAEVYGTALPTPRELLAAGERWRPYRSVASWYFWRVLDTPGARV